MGKYKTVVTGIVRQVLLGVGMAAGQAIVETGQQLSVRAIQTKLQQWGVNLDPNSAVGLLLENFGSNVGSQLSNELMISSAVLLGDSLQKLEDSYIDERSRVYDEINSNVSSFKNTISGAFNVFRGKWGKSSVDVVLSEQREAYDNAVSKDKLEAVKGIYRMRNSVYTSGHALGNVMGVNNSAYSAMTSITDDTKFFDAVQYLINMKKVG